LIHKTPLSSFTIRTTPKSSQPESEIRVFCHFRPFNSGGCQGSHPGLRPGIQVFDLSSRAKTRDPWLAEGIDPGSSPGVTGSGG
jgi:hypothetical protein